MAVLTEEQVILRDQASAWVSEEAPVARFRAMRDAGTEVGFAEETWKAICELGWSGILIPEEYGGSGMDYRTFGVVLEQTGRGLTASPLLASGLMGASALLLGGTDAQKKRYLPEIASGSTIVTLAVDETSQHDPQGVAMTATAAGDGFELTGRKLFVMEGAAADALVVAARTSGQAGDAQGLTLFIVDTAADGITRTPLKTVDARGYADIVFDKVKVSAEAVLGGVGDGYAPLEAILDRGRAGLAAEMLGTGAEAFDRTLEYLKTRVQFDQVIGSFQSLGHRQATHFMNMELARSCVDAALTAIDQDGEDVGQLCSLAKCEVGEFLHDMTNDMIQMHGGIGMTDEFDAGFFIKRARAAETLLGNRAYHRRRYAGFLGI
ncbi:MAG: acyl-CoA dehydrogenase family protein [Pseudomonadales bacterium]|jgi:alkylation response protein AidB-like acyl-CoA dehydrogenase